MDFIAIARRWIATVLAAVLSASVDVIEAVLPSQPRWLAQIRALALELRAAEERGAAASGSQAAVGPEERAVDIGALLESHTVLQQSLLDFEARGLGLDSVLLERMAKDWTPSSIVSYLQACEQQLRQRSAEALAVASAPFGGGPTGGETSGPPSQTTGPPAPKAD